MVFIFEHLQAFWDQHQYPRSANRTEMTWNGTHPHSTVFALSEAYRACLVAERPFLL